MIKKLLILLLSLVFCLSIFAFGCGDEQEEIPPQTPPTVEGEAPPATQPLAIAKSNVFKPVTGVDKMQDGFEFNDRYFTSSVKLDTTKLSIPTSENGVVVFANSSVMEFQYTNVIDMRNFGKEDTIIELLPYIGEKDKVGVGYAKISHITITLTDTENIENSVALHYEEDGSNKAVYSRVMFDGNDMACVFNSDGTKTIRNGEYGAYAGTGSSFGHYNTDPKNIYDHAQGAIGPFTFNFDYANKYVYMNAYSPSFISTTHEVNNASFKLAGVIDLDDEGQVGIGKSWQGFTNDTVTLSVKVEFEEAITSEKKGGIIVKSIIGQNLAGGLTEETDYPAPEIGTIYDEYDQTLPNGCVNLEYPVPKVFSTDWYYGITADDKISVEVLKKEGEEYGKSVFTAGNGGTFTPTEVGEYKIIYTAKNEKHSSTYERLFKVDAEETPIFISPASAPPQPKLRDYFTIPEILTSGGSGNISKIETCYYNGLEVELDGERRVYVDKAGSINLKVECNDYVGAPVIKNFTYNVTDKIMLIVENVPQAIVGGNNETLILPSATAYDIETNAAIDVAITANGGTLNAETRELKTDKTSGQVTVKYTAGGKEEVYLLNVLDKDRNFTPSSFVKPIGNATVSDSIDGININALKEGDGVQWLYPVVTGFGSDYMKIKVKNVAGKIDYDYLDFIFNDYSNLNRGVTIRVSKMASNPNASMIQVKGYGKETQLSVGLNVDNNILDFYVANNTLYTNNGIMLCDFSSIYDAQLSMFSLKFGGVVQGGKIGICLAQIGNQELNYNANEPELKWLEAAPVLLFDKPLAKTQLCATGGTVTLPAAKAFDLTSSSATVELKVTASNKVVELKGSVEEGATFKVKDTFKGKLYYFVVYTVKDGNGTEKEISFIVQVVDTLSPVITLSQKINSQIAVGSSVIIPSATATDNVDGDCKVTIMIRELKTRVVYGVTAGEIVTFDKEGKYEIIYNATDKSGNLTSYTYVVEVK